jgi:hypothetical protein
MAKNLQSPEEMGEGKRPARGGDREEGGFSEGTFGRGPTPYLKSKHGGVEGSIAKHSATSGRGGSGIIGKGDSFKGHAEDLEHPQSHKEFEMLGQEGAGGGVGGAD